VSDKLNFTYYIGAGASCGVLPMVKQFPEKLDNFRVKLIDIGNDNSKEFTSEENHYLDKFIENIQWLKQSAENHASIDTFAKKLYIKNELNNVLKLKATLSCYFLILQGMNNVDQRYDTFFASITNRDKDDNPTLPDNIKIILWNYDIQFEKAFNIYLDNIKYLSTRLQAPPITGERFEFDYKKFGIIRLNGIAGVHQKNDGNIGRYFKEYIFNKCEEVTLLKEILLIYKQYIEQSDNFSPMLNFAWEKSSFQNEYLSYARTIAVKTNVLIIIGYSFPFFNRDIDKSILNNIGDLKKVYLQVPQEDQQAYKERLLAIRTGLKESDIISITDKEQFYIPNEFD